ncbi:MAG: VOC family protein [Pseudomonadota bacterium]|jgi:lactoylglutathione lyase|nr:VOC family protein [Pseudomonadota bacterium]
MAEYLSAVGIAVADLQVAARFYERALGMTSLQTITLPEMEEIILGFKGTRSAAVILMKYTDGTHIKNNDKVGKLVFYVNNISGTLEAIRDAGCRVEREAKVIDSMGGAIIGFARDPDGHQLELIQKAPKA